MVILACFLYILILKQKSVLRRSKQVENLLEIGAFVKTRFMQLSDELITRLKGCVKFKDVNYQIRLG